MTSNRDIAGGTGVTGLRLHPSLEVFALSLTSEVFSPHRELVGCLLGTLFGVRESPLGDPFSCIVPVFFLLLFYLDEDVGGFTSPQEETNCDLYFVILETAFVSLGHSRSHGPHPTLPPACLLGGQLTLVLCPAKTVLMQT